MRIRGSVARRAVTGASLTLIAAAIWCLTPAHRASAVGETRTLHMYNIHTKETLDVTFKRDGKYDEAALKQINTFMRDWRADKETKMDPELIDLIWTLHEKLGSKEPIHLISGFRSATTNAALRRRGGGQAKKSQHILGKAADIHFPDVSVKVLRNSALVQEVGGVGYYPTSGIPFVHVDTGRVRMWPRIPRLELAALFPAGRTGYLPTDGKPITRQDYKLAEAKGLVGKATLVASAAPAPRTGSEADNATTGFDTPKPILASYTPDASDFGGASREPTPPGRLFTYASVDGGSLPFSNLFGSAKKPASRPSYEEAVVVGAPEADDDHSEELSYVPFEVADLMTDTSLAYSHTLAPLVHPEQKNIDYMFENMDRPTNFTFRRNASYQGLVAVQQFSGQAVKSLYADAQTQAAPTRLAQRTP
jgi:uncharacterized protein YcbK (DUF882 family)